MPSDPLLRGIFARGEAASTAASEGALLTALLEVEAALTRACVVGPAHAEHVHHRATSQDILDTALMLLAAGALGPSIVPAANGAFARAQSFLREEGIE